MATENEPCGLDKDPAAYLALPRFNQTLDFSFELGGETQPATVGYALTYAPPSESWPVLLFFNGLGGHRLIIAMTEGIARSHQVQMLTLDKSGAGSSKCHGIDLPLSDRTRWMHTALLAVLAHLQISRFAILAHSNGIFYSLYTMLHLPPSLTATSWTLSGPFVPQTISGSIALRAAAALPAPLPNALGTLLQAVPPVARMVNWSGGMLSMSKGLLFASVGKERANEEERQERKPAHERGYIHRYVNSACQEATMRRAMEESRVSMGQEALFTLHGNDPVASTTSATGSSPSNPPLGAAETDCVWGLGPGATSADILKGAFTRVAELYPDDALKMQVVYGADDGMVPVQGRVWLRGVLEEVGLISAHSVESAGVEEVNAATAEDAEDVPWVEVPGAGHDDVLFLEQVVGRILERV
ncbi:hypothetical protein K438DRAFT_1795068 [Mycena galopus ATCC 62051]|nr:hypothetical protein K438DRAFT_1795068 [Mycena galopus ATCC 62051]